jgi:transcriptional regulator with XRE-family HTH domain
MNRCEKCGTGRLETRTLSEFSVAALVGTPFPVVLEDAVVEKFCAHCGAVAGHKIPEPDQLTAVVAIMRSCDPMKLNGREIRFLRKSMGWKAKELADRLAITPEHLSRFENGKVTVSEVYERLIRAFVCLVHVETAPHIDLDLSKFAEMKIISVRDAARRSVMRLTRERVPEERFPKQKSKSVKWKREKQARVAA